MVLDAMSIREYIQYDQKAKRNFGYVDCGARSTAGNSNDVVASDALVAMLVSMKGNWKIPLGYFLTRSITADVQAGIVREALLRTFDCGVRVRVVTMDGTAHNTSTFKVLGCNILPKKIV